MSPGRWTLELELAGTAVDPWGNTRSGLEGTAVPNGKDWAVNVNSPLEPGGVLVGENVTLEFEISAVNAA
ncbi:MAG: hypothetical protein OEY41_14705 [Acidimicrobiia bacterium]|nr:hypothetical protein [Acidimicrobiia bacterium]MDH5291241.1 hypothetical protein [Acidimicrobiia bacterium]